MAHPTIASLVSTNLPPTLLEPQHISGLLSAGEPELEILDEQMLKASLGSLIAPNRFPPELLAEIFLYCRQNNLKCDLYSITGPMEAPLLLGRICASWRTISQNTPRLWDAIHFNTNYPRTDHLAPYIHQLAAKSGGFPISLGINNHSPRPRALSPSSHTPMGIIWDFRQRLQDFRLDLTEHDYRVSTTPAKALLSILSSIVLKPDDRELFALDLPSILDIFQTTPWTWQLSASPVNERHSLPDPSHSMTGILLMVQVGTCAGAASYTITGPTVSVSDATVEITWIKDTSDVAPFTIVISPEGVAGSTTLATSVHPDDLVLSLRFCPFQQDDIVVASSDLQIVAAGASQTSSSAPASSSSASGSNTSSSVSPTSSAPDSSMSTSSTAMSTPGATKHHSHAGAIAGGVVGGVGIIVLAALGWWYLRRRRQASASPGSGDITEQPRFLAARVTGSGLPSNASEPQEFRPWEQNEVPVHPTIDAPAAPTDPKQPVALRWEPPQAPPGLAQPHPPPQGPAQATSRERELEEEVRQLRQQLVTSSPPSYAGHE
ncbi:hypothetical protein FB451DRAFT_1532991 [Mycena latifolia]|nr:hypothetical protein FB451DRAFT_1532991 [Mycena latifolia]